MWPIASVTSNHYSRLLLLGIWHTFNRLNGLIFLVENLLINDETVCGVLKVIIILIFSQTVTRCWLVWLLGALTLCLTLLVSSELRMLNRSNRVYLWDERTDNGSLSTETPAVIFLKPVDKVVVGHWMRSQQPGHDDLASQPATVSQLFYPQ